MLIILETNIIKGSNKVIILTIANTLLSSFNNYIK